MAKNMPDNLDELLSAYIDDELSDAERAKVERLSAENPDVLARLNALRRTVNLVQSLPRHDAPATLADDIAAQAERRMLLGDDESLSVARPRRRRSIISGLATAALVTITVGGGLWVVYQVGQHGRRQDSSVRVAVGPKAAPLAPEGKMGMASTATRSRGKEASPRLSKGRENAAIEAVGRMAGRASDVLDVAGVGGAKRDKAEEAKPAEAHGTFYAQLDEERAGKLDAMRESRARKAGAVDEEAADESAVVAMAPTVSSGLAHMEHPPRPVDESYDVDTYERHDAGGFAATLAEASDRDVMVLNVECPDEEARRATLRRLTAYLDTRQIALRDSREDASLGQPAVSGVRSALRSLDELEAEEAPSEWVVAVTADELRPLVGSLAGTEGQVNGVSLEGGPFAAKGTERVMQLFAFATSGPATVVERRRELSESAPDAEAPSSAADAFECSKKQAPREGGAGSLAQSKEADKKVPVATAERVVDDEASREVAVAKSARRLQAHRMVAPKSADGDLPVTQAVLPSPSEPSAPATTQPAARARTRPAKAPRPFAVESREKESEAPVSYVTVRIRFGLRAGEPGKPVTTQPTATAPASARPAANSQPAGPSPRAPDGE